jgi:hypothetical protein
MVDEAAPNTTDYNSSATVDQKDTLTFPDMSTPSGSVFAVQTCLWAAKSDAGARTTCHVTRSGGADYDGTAFAPATTYTYYQKLMELDPNGDIAWTIANVNAAEFGYKVVT